MPVSSADWHFFLGLFFEFGSECFLGLSKNGRLITLNTAALSGTGGVATRQEHVVCAILQKSLRGVVVQAEMSLVLMLFVV